MKKQGNAASIVEEGAGIVPGDMLPHPHSLVFLIQGLETLCRKNHGSKVSVQDVVDMLGPRSFAPVILAVGLIAVTPIDSVPTLPTTFGAIIFLAAAQMLAGRRSLWLPRIVARRAVNAEKLLKALDRLMPLAQKADSWIGMRLTVLTRGPFLLAMAACCAVLALTMPFLEIFPLVSTLPSLAFVAFGIAFLMGDGLAALAGFALTAAALTVFFALIKAPLMFHAFG
jgi:hypothetical protein